MLGIFSFAVLRIECKHREQIIILKTGNLRPPNEHGAVDIYPMLIVPGPAVPEQARTKSLSSIRSHRRRPHWIKAKLAAFYNATKVTEAHGSGSYKGPNSIEGHLIMRFLHWSPRGWPERCVRLLCILWWWSFSPPRGSWSPTNLIC